jgi:hypothetical protein
MPQPDRTAFEHFAARKRRAAETARIARLTTTLDRRADTRVIGIGNAWTRAHHGGDFDVAAPQEDQTALSLVFVQSKDGNTAGADPAALGAAPPTSI